MKKAFRLVLCLSLVAGIDILSGLRVEAQTNAITNAAQLIRTASQRVAKLPQLPRLPELPKLKSMVSGDFSALARPMFGYDLIPSPFAFTADTATLLDGAIMRRLGMRYYFSGADDRRGYDCSGFVWRVFRDAGADFDRVAARTLWRQLPEARGEETRIFGTLVFFNGLKHIGIVRDAASFYHASRSQGITLSQYAGYWEKRVTGFRRAPVEVVPLPPDLSSDAESPNY
ncbi:MAG: C40 family peptidase [Blastocatellia bacterium]